MATDKQIKLIKDVSEQLGKEIPIGITAWEGKRVSDYISDLMSQRTAGQNVSKVASNGSTRADGAKGARVGMCFKLTCEATTKTGEANEEFIHRFKLLYGLATECEKAV